MAGSAVVYVVDPDRAARQAVARVASALGLACCEFATGEEFFKEFDPFHPGCAILELRVPDIHGFEIQQRLAAVESCCPVVFWTAHTTVGAAVRALRAGALNFLEKPITDQDLETAIDEALRRASQDYRHQVRRQRAAGYFKALTIDERELLEMLVAGEHNKVIAFELGVCLRTVELRRRRLMKKLKVSSTSELIQLILWMNENAPVASPTLMKG